MDQTVLAFHRKLPLDERPLTELIDQVGPGRPNSDFAIVVLVRILFFISKTNMTDYYDKLILPALQSEHYWYTTEDGVANDDTMNSENHMILWMSSAWLLQEKYGWDLKDVTLQQRLLHHLNLKIEYGFYEFLSITYTPYSFNGLLNLVDFCQDQEIKSLAGQAIRRLVSDYLWFVNDKGVHYTAAGRDYAERFIAPPYTQDMDGIVYLISGMGSLKREAMNLSSFLATSTIDFTRQAAKWQPSMDTTFSYGHTLQESFQINSKLNKYDRIVFQFSQGASQTAQVVVSGCNRRSYLTYTIPCSAFQSSGAYFHPLTARDSIDFFKHFGPIRLNEQISLSGKFLPSGGAAQPMAKLLDRLTVGTVMSGNDIKVYRQAGSMLTSVDKYWPGVVGGQVFPWMAVADDVPVWTQSGLVTTNWLDKDGSLTNSHLPMSSKRAMWP
jgi:hypothetical protein